MARTRSKSQQDDGQDVVLLGVTTVGACAGEGASSAPPGVSELVVEQVRGLSDPSPHLRIKASQRRTSADERAWLRGQGWGWNGRQWWRW